MAIKRLKYLEWKINSLSADKKKIEEETTVIQELF